MPGCNASPNALPDAVTDAVADDSTDTLAPVDAPLDQRAEHPEDVPTLGDALRGVLRQVASPVVVVTVGAGDGARGATIGSFASVSLDPPTVSFNVTHGTRLHAALLAHDVFAVGLLASDQAEIAERFARPDLAPADWPTLADASAPPRLAGVLGTLVCRVVARVEVAGSTLVLGLVEAVEPGREALPLLYLRQRYRTVG